MQSSNKFEEFEGQNFLEVRYKKEDFNELSSNEAYQKYKKNVREDNTDTNFAINDFSFFFY